MIRVTVALGLRPRQVRLVAGSTGRRKIVELVLRDASAPRERLLAHSLRA